MSEVEPEIVQTLEDDSGAFCVDIHRHAEGDYSYVEYARDDEDESAWHPREDAPLRRYPSEFAAYSAAMRDVEWLSD